MPDDPAEPKTTDATAGFTPWQRLPSVTLLLPTRDRPSFLPIALACVSHQTYPVTELLVLDDGRRFPAGSEMVAAAGGRIMTSRPGTPIGTKLNIGAEAAVGTLCLKIDDDDWYGPDYVATMVARLTGNAPDHSGPVLTAVASFLTFNILRWEIHRAMPNQSSGATLCFRREDWAAAPFLPVNVGEDLNFVRDQIRRGTRVLTVPAPNNYLYVRHGGAARNRGHTGKYWDEQKRTLLPETQVPETLLPSWAVDAYQELRSGSHASDSVWSRLKHRVRAP